MANVKITELTDIGTPASDDVLEIVDISTNTSKKVQVSALGGGATPTLAEVLNVGGREIKDASGTTYEFIASDKSKYLIFQGFEEQIISEPNIAYFSEGDVLTGVSGIDGFNLIIDNTTGFINPSASASFTLNFLDEFQLTCLGVGAWILTITRYNSTGGSATDLAYTPSPTNGIVTSSTGTDATLPLADGTNAGLLKPADFTQLSTLATDLADKVDKSDYTPAHSILVQQSGTGSPSALQIGNNTLVGRLSGGGSNINDLSVSDVKTLLSINNVDNTSDANKPISTATQTALDLRTREILQDFTDYTSTGVLTEQIISNQAITANDMKINSWLNLISTYSRTGTTNATVAIYLSTNSNNIAGAVKIATATITSTQSLPCFKRDYSINASSVLRGILFTANAVTDEIATQAQSTTTLTLGSAYYLITTVTLNGITDTVTQRAINLKSSK